MRASLPVLGLLVVLGLIVGYSGWRALTSAARAPGGSEVQPRDPAVLVLAAAEETANGHGAPDEAPIRSPATVAEASEASADEVVALRGVVLDPELVPVAGAAVEVWRDEEADEFSFLELKRRRSLEASGESDSKGCFAFRVPAGQPLVVEVAAEGYARARVTHRFAGEHVEIQLTLPGTVRGFVDRAVDGLPVADAEVRLRSQYQSGAFDRRLRSVRTDASGGYVIPGLAAGSYTLGVLPRTEAASETLRFELAPGETLRQDVTVQEGFVVTGRVTDAATNLPIAGATIGEGWSYGRTVHTDSTGTFRFEGVSPRTYALQAKAVGYGETEVHIPREQGDGDFEPDEVRVELELLPAHRVRGRVVDREGEPIAEAYVAAVASETRGPHRQQHTDWRSVITGVEGTFDITDVRPDITHTLLVRRAGYGTAVYEFPADESERAVVDLGDIVLSPGVLLYGVVVDDSGRPHANQPLTLVGSNADRGRMSGGRDATWMIDTYVAERDSRTDHTGRFGFADLSAGTYTLSASLPGHSEEQSLEVVLVDGREPAEVRFVLRRGLSITGHVSAVDGSTLPSVYVHADAAEGDSSGVGYVEDDGRFAIEGLASGEYTVTVAVERASDDLPTDASFADAQLSGIRAGTEGLLIQLARNVPVSGVVLDSLGMPAGGAYVEARNGEGLMLGYVRTDDEGRFTLQLPPDTTVDLTGVPPSPEENLTRWDPEVFARVFGVSTSARPEDLTLRLSWSP